MKKLLCLLLALILCLGLLPAGATAAAPVEVQLTQALLCCTLAARALPGAQAPVPPDPANPYHHEQDQHLHIHHIVNKTKSLQEYPSLTAI